MTVKSTANRSDGHDSLENECIAVSSSISLAEPHSPLIPDSDCSVDFCKQELVVHCPVEKK
jgi:hypothetical protein